MLKLGDVMRKQDYSRVESESPLNYVDCVVVLGLQPRIVTLFYCSIDLHDLMFLSSSPCFPVAAEEEEEAAERERGIKPKGLG